MQVRVDSEGPQQGASSRSQHAKAAAALRTSLTDNAAFLMRASIRSGREEARASLLGTERLFIRAGDARGI